MGFRLSANIFLPKAEGKFPVIFQRMPYGESGNGIGKFYAQRGYTYLIQDCRGRYDSAGGILSMETILKMIFFKL